MSATTLERPTDTGTDSPALRRLQLIDAGWRTLTAATDPRDAVADDGVEITIAHWPEFRSLGVPSGMSRPGRHDDAPGAAYVETYVRRGRSWHVI